MVKRGKLTSSKIRRTEEIGTRSVEEIPNTERGKSVLRISSLRLVPKERKSKRKEKNDGRSIQEKRLPWETSRPGQEKYEQEKVERRIP